MNDSRYIIGILLSCFILSGTAKTVDDNKKINIDGVYYRIHEDADEAEVTFSTQRKYCGDIIIPAKISYGGKEFKVTSIGSDAFAFCDSLVSIELPNTIYKIGINAFNRCCSLKTMAIPESVKRIDAYAFLWCKELNTIKIPETVESIDPSAFFCCHGLQEDNGIRYAGPLLVEVADKERQVYTIKDGTRWIGTNAFSFLPRLESIIIPETVEAIGPYAFSGCGKLKSVNILNGTKRILTCAFSSCLSLKSVILPQTIKHVWADIFLDCEELNMIICYSILPPKMEIGETITNCFYRFNPNSCTLFVPKRNMRSYKKDACWSNFKRIRKIRAVHNNIMIS